MPDVVIVDVFPRDGLQAAVHEPALRLPTTAEKADIIAALDAAGVPEIEITGFVHPRVIPSLADAEAVAALATAAPHRAVLRALVPNLHGARRALDAGMTKLAGLVVASETYQRLNANMSVEENLEQLARIKDEGDRRGVAVMVGVGTSFVCPYEGVVPAERLLWLVERLVRLGYREVSLADSVGLAVPALVRDRVARILDRWPDLELGLHLHTLAGTALGNAWVAYEAGVRRFEGSVGGIGGGIAMPVHVTEMANVATEDLVYLFEASGVRTGIDQARLTRLAEWVTARVGTGSGRTMSFGDVATFVGRNRARLAELEARRPGDSRVAHEP
ncbi:MAG: hydroxymethylglutaryl-CoA lyase [Actinomycetia bacterium]|nr:hydroxymethylglutaryl-CoA lyase [Actinomycetes bacterium]